MVRQLNKLVILTCALSLFFIQVKSQDISKLNEKIENATQVLKDFGSMKERIPEKLLDISQGIIIVPKMINAGFVLAGKRGKGIAMVKLPDGTWSNPVFVTITGGSLGFQVGIQAVDLVLIFKQRSTLQEIGNGSFTLGGDISATAGPVGRNSTASTDYKMEAEVYSYSRSKGLFAGISLSGSAIDIDKKANESFYKDFTSAEDLFSNGNENESDLVMQMKHELSSLYN
ncbi:MAG: lipid-binding SYLF domain-containing protein [Bacteroidota bacterium]|nr:lipid-binding SYLF domain-containing protein [Bacteroidota bacterium]